MGLLLYPKNSIPIILFNDTPGANAVIKSKEQSQVEANARNLREKYGLKVPIVETII